MKDTVPSWTGSCLSVALAVVDGSDLVLAASVLVTLLTAAYTGMRMWDLWRKWRGEDQAARKRDTDDSI